MKRSLLIQVTGLKLLGLGLILMTDWTLLGVFVFLSGGIVLMAHMLSPGAQGLCDVVTGFCPQGNEIWLTIDDGPNCDDTRKILDLLDLYGAKATFFMIGERAEHYPELVKEVIARGHSVGCHTYSHPLWNFWIAGRKRVQWELDQSLRILNQLGARVTLFRSPVGIKNVFLRKCLEARGLQCIAWSIRSADGYSNKRKRIIRHVLEKVKPGAILLMHEGNDVASNVRVRAMAEILEELNKRHYKCVVPQPESFIPRFT